jgi:hypothetical protein
LIVFVVVRFAVVTFGDIYGLLDSLWFLLGFVIWSLGLLGGCRLENG